jgi:hypothetical protein
MTGEVGHRNAVVKIQEDDHPVIRADCLTKGFSLMKLISILLMALALLQLNCKNRLGEKICRMGSKRNCQSES